MYLDRVEIEEIDCGIVTTKGTIARKDLEKANKTAGNAKKETHCDNTPSINKLAHAKRCPFVDGASSLCTNRCCMHVPNGCAIVTGDHPTAGECPFTKGGYRRICSKECALYDDGCAMIKKKE